MYLVCVCGRGEESESRFDVSPLVFFQVVLQFIFSKRGRGAEEEGMNTTLRVGGDSQALRCRWRQSHGAVVLFTNRARLSEGECVLK
jgi:hypothetical protein